MISVEGECRLSLKTCWRSLDMLKEVGQRFIWTVLSILWARTPLDITRMKPIGHSVFSFLAQTLSFYQKE